MKKHRKFFLLALTCLICAFTLGFFLGRNANHTVPALTLSDHSAETAPSRASAGSADRVNINTATLSQLAELPGIGEVLAQRILDYRAENGDFRTTADLLCVSGIGESRLEAILDLITVGG